jgi:hypothetical protein
LIEALLEDAMGRLVFNRARTIVAVFLAVGVTLALAVDSESLAAQGEKSFGTNLGLSDSDGDGITDAQEETLLLRFRPYLRFSFDGDNERYPPADPIWYIKHSQLLTTGVEDNFGVFGVYSQPQLAADSSLVLAASIDTVGYSDLRRYRAKTQYHLNILNDYRHGYANGDGFDWSAVLAARNIGLFGHVIPYGPLIKIEYWQFFAYNSVNADCFLFNCGDFGDHEGDWCVVALLYDPRHDMIHKVFHYAHGKEMAYEMALTASQADVRASEVEYQGPRYSTSGGIELDHGHIVIEAQNNLVRFWRDPDTGKFEHPVVYLEHGSHEGFPGPYWSFSGAPKHNGLSYSFLTSTPQNLGEVGSEGSGTSEIIKHYNGLWGAYGGTLDLNSPPPGPTLHSEWTWPEGDPLPGGIEDQATSWHQGPPVAVAGGDRTLECEGGGTALLNLDGGASYDRDGLDDIVGYDWHGLPGGVRTGRIQTVTLGMGTYPIKLVVHDKITAQHPEGLSSQDAAVIRVVDTRPPSVVATSAPNVLWPPNHKWVPVHVSVTATDICDENPDWVLESVSSSDPPDSTGDGHTSPDIRGFVPGTPSVDGELRAERRGGRERKYTLVYSARDASGNVRHTSAEIAVAAHGPVRSAAIQNSRSLTGETLRLLNGRIIEGGRSIVLSLVAPGSTDVDIRVFDVLGRLVAKGSVSRNSAGSSTASLRSDIRLSHGIFFVRATSGTEVSEGRVLYLR